MIRSPLLALALAAALPTLALAQPAPAASAPVAAPAPSPAEEARLHTDWAWLGRYREDDARRAARAERPDVVFMGDSITQGWIDKVPAFFTAGRLDRGIGGQTTPQMLVRFRQDVIDLKPRAVHIMAGTNDIAGNTGPMTAEETQGFIASMAELARAHGIKVILASIPPAARFPWRPGLETVQKIRALNAWIRDYAARTGATYADYTAVLADPAGGMKPGLAYDGVHPTAAGYGVMQPVTERAIRAALGAPAAR